MFLKTSSPRYPAPDTQSSNKLRNSDVPYAINTVRYDKAQIKILCTTRACLPLSRQRNILAEIERGRERERERERETGVSGASRGTDSYSGATALPLVEATLFCNSYRLETSRISINEQWASVLPTKFLRAWNIIIRCRVVQSSVAGL